MTFDERDIQLELRLSRAEAMLHSAGFRKSADGKVWVPPVNEAATKLYQLRNKVRTLAEVLLKEIE
jgi:hypothetical protein